MGDFGDFLQQIPAPLVINCFVTLASFMGLLIYFSYIRPKRKQAEKAKLENPVAPLNAVPLPDDEDLPDLDMLLTDHEPFTPTPDPLPVTKPEPVPTPKPYAPGHPLTVIRDQVVRLPDGRVVNGKPVLTILRDSTDNRLMIHMDDSAYRSFVDFPEIKQRFTALMKELAESTARPDDSPASAEPAAVDQPPAIEQPSEATLEELVSTPAPEAPVMPKFTPPPPAADGSMPGDLPNYREITSEPVKRGLFGMPKYEPPPLPEFNLAAAIEAYLQHKLRYTPEYMHRSIHIHNAPDGGVRIEVDGRFYESVAEVADPDVRTFISTAIQEWQDRQ